MDPFYERKLEVNMCRLCFTMAANQQPITKSPYAHEFNNFNFIELQIGYDLPVNVCGQCLLQLNQLGAFLKMCKDSFHICKQMRTNEENYQQCLQVGNNITDIKQEVIDSESEEVFEPTMDTVDESDTSFENTSEKETMFETVITKSELDVAADHSCDEKSDTDAIENAENGTADPIKTCQTCGTNVVALLEHYSKNPECRPKSAYCSRCNLRFRNKRRLLHHQTTHHADKVPATFLMCHICSKKFRFPGSLSQHLQTHENDEQYVDGNVSNTSESGNSQCTPLGGAEVGRDSINNLLPPKSSSIYHAAYQRFINWRTDKNLKDFSEDVLLDYFAEQANELKMKSPTMWSQYSMIKSILNIKHGVDLSKYLKLRAYLKKQNEGYTPKKAKALTKEQFDRFLAEASDVKYLGIKVIMVFGISGACRCEELVRLKVDDIQDLGSLLLIRIPNSKTNKTRSFTVMGDEYINTYRKYAALRPAQMTERRFFLKYINGACCRMVMGIHKIGSAAKEVASYLQLPDWQEYTGHSFRRTSATLLDDGTRYARVANL